MNTIYRRLLERGITIDHVCEVGVYLPETSNILDFIKEGKRSTLVEADPEIIRKLEQHFKNYENVKIYPYAIWDKNGFVKLSKAQASTFVSDLESSPALKNDDYTISKDKIIEVPCKMFSEIDDGTIDLLSIDIEGSEWYVLKHLKSIPKVISVETHGNRYTNPYLEEILNWTSENNYDIWYKDFSDSVFVRNDVFEINKLEELAVKWMDIRINLRKFRKSLFN